MTTYTTITNGEIDQDSPVTQALMTALRDNPLAIREGDASAPKIHAINAMSHGGIFDAVGTYMMAGGNVSTNTDYDANNTIAGADLDPCGIDNTAAPTSYYTRVDSAWVPNGTWRCMGYANNSTGGVRTITLWQRIA